MVAHPEGALRAVCQFHARAMSAIVEISMARKMLRLSTKDETRMLAASTIRDQLANVRRLRAERPAMQALAVNVARVIAGDFAASTCSARFRRIGPVKLQLRQAQLSIATGDLGPRYWSHPVLLELARLEEIVDASMSGGCGA